MCYVYVSYFLFIGILINIGNKLSPLRSDLERRGLPMPLPPVIMEEVTFGNFVFSLCAIVQFDGPHILHIMCDGTVVEFEFDRFLFWL